MSMTQRRKETGAGILRGKYVHNKNGNGVAASWDVRGETERPGERRGELD